MQIETAKKIHTVLDFPGTACLDKPETSPIELPGVLYGAKKSITSSRKSWSSFSPDPWEIKSSDNTVLVSFSQINASLVLTDQNSCIWTQNMIWRQRWGHTKEYQGIWINVSFIDQNNAVIETVRSVHELPCNFNEPVTLTGNCRKDTFDFVRGVHLSIENFSLYEC